MTTAIIGIGNIGGRLARDLVRGGVPVVLAAKDEAHADGLARELGELASAGSVEEAIAAADVAVFAVWSGDGRPCAAGTSTACAPARDASAEASPVSPRARAAAGAGAVAQAPR